MASSGTLFVSGTRNQTKITDNIIKLKRRVSVAKRSRQGCEEGCSRSEKEVNAVSHCEEHLGRETGNDKIPEPVTGGSGCLTKSAGVGIKHLRVDHPWRTSRSQHWKFASQTRWLTHSTRVYRTLSKDRRKRRPRCHQMKDWPAL